MTRPLTAQDGQQVKVALQRFTAAAGPLEQIAAKADRVLGRLDAG
ncbi:hypothetical protein [Corallococcus exercitus]|nr:hypothetical protein [Corallococcus exercitus]